MLKKRPKEEVTGLRSQALCRRAMPGTRSLDFYSFLLLWAGIKDRRI